MSERLSTSTPRAGVCPFLALEDDRDHRLSSPDHRHRCFAESPAAPRALAHQNAYCLSPAFPGCPTFIDWARREAAPARAREDAPAEEVARPAATTHVSTDSAAHERRPGFISISPEEAARPGWADPPPWVPDRPQGGEPAEDRPPIAFPVGPAAAAPPLEDQASLDVEADLPVPPPATPFGRPARAEHEPPVRREPPVEPPARFTPTRSPGWAEGTEAHAFEPPVPPAPESPAAPPGHPLWGSPDVAAEPPRTPQSASDRAPLPPRASVAPAAGGDEPASPPARERGPRGPVGYAPVPEAQKSPRARTGRSAPDPAAPAWERPRTFEDYGSLRSGPGKAEPVRKLLLVVLGAALVLFLLPIGAKMIFGGGSGSSAGASPSAAASATPDPTGTPAPTPKPAPTPIVHVVKSGETLGKIAQTYGVSVDQILAANPKIKNPDRIKLGDQIIIPTNEPSEIPDASASGAPESGAPESAAP